jgi:hypothetical protein
MSAAGFAASRLDVIADRGYFSGPEILACETGSRHLSRHNKCMRLLMRFW